jgi:hypothetical protein
MIELVIERWDNFDGSVDFRWSLWRDGRRLHMNAEAYSSAEACEADARLFCRRGFGRDPDKVTRL